LPRSGPAGRRPVPPEGPRRERSARPQVWPQASDRPWGVPRGEM